MILKSSNISLLRSFARERTYVVLSRCILLKKEKANEVLRYYRDLAPSIKESANKLLETI